MQYLFPESASTTAVWVDNYISFLILTTGAIALLVATLVISFSVIYRRRSPTEIPPQYMGSLKLEIAWTGATAVLAMIMFGWGARVFVYATQVPPNAQEVFVVAKQWMWKIQHPEGQREINELHVPLGRPVRLTMTSEDVIHSFFVPAFRMKADVLPGRYRQMWFQATKVGSYHLFCSQYCGTNHSGMVGRVIVMPPDDYEAWLAGRAEGSMALEGRKLFLKYQCASCHAADALSRAPVLEGLYGQRVPMTDGSTAIADENYLRESILNPRAHIVAGYEPIMPTFQGQINEEEVLKLIAFIKALRPGQTPPRIDDAAPPKAEEPAQSKPSVEKKS